ncbi:hypothetical protein GCM10022262_33880 [Georgenia daeguensis]|uniref:Uncharacterized protein n=1 Tax=Georgenia daeguensis TaxID=908355 RepID=A0ABP8EYX7_9MICO
MAWCQGLLVRPKCGEDDVGQAAAQQAEGGNAVLTAALELLVAASPRSEYLPASSIYPCLPGRIATA